MFVAMPSVTANGAVIIGKNSDRPSDEVQELIYQAAANHETGDKLQVGPPRLQTSATFPMLLFSLAIILYLINYFTKMMYQVAAACYLIHHETPLRHSVTMYHILIKVA